MTNNSYRLRYLPLFYNDLEDKVIYISDKLQNPQAANDLFDAVKIAIYSFIKVRIGMQYNIRRR